MPLLMDLAEDYLNRMKEEFNDPFDMSSLISTCQLFEHLTHLPAARPMVTIADRTALRPVSLRYLTTLPNSLRRHYVAMSRFRNLASEDHLPPDRERRAIRYHRLWFVPWTDTDTLTGRLAPRTGIGFLSAAVFPFIQDYIYKATTQADPTAQSRRTRLEMYEKAPCWAHSTMRRCAVPPQVLYDLFPMREAFAVFQVYYYMHKALEGFNIKTFDHRPTRHELFQDTLLHDFCMILEPIVLDRFRSILWYVSSLWAILLDEIDHQEDLPHCPRPDILCYLCSSGLLMLRKVLCAPPEQRRTSK
ncbi:hypothetical protein F5B21DRAFT_522204 [Xylaria acuta]|nr:hypothetical protein F5B21DRAFT_522204 [Xylaria acuta]